jgi:hypothetical protein
MKTSWALAAPLFAMTSLIVGPAWSDVLYGVQITKLYAQSRLDSDANLIQVSATLSSACSMNRLYIDMNDKELFASALANYMADRPVDIVFVTNGAPKMAAGHVGGITCRLMSIF